MTAKMWLISSMIFVVSISTGCSEKECKPTIEYVDRYHEKLIPVKCDVKESDVYCEKDETNTSTGVINSLLICIHKKNAALDACRGIER